MKPVPAKPLEDVVVSRLKELNDNQDLVSAIVENASSESSELLKILKQTKADLFRQGREVQRKLEALLESIADRKVGIKSISRKIIEIEEQKEQVEDEILNIEIQIESTKEKIVNVDGLKEGLTTFSN